MLLWHNDGRDPFRNMATEEFLLMTTKEPCVMLWQNDPAVVIGKNQDARSEVDFDFASRNGIKIVRRLSGGGAVFHDKGNINYSFIIPDGAALQFAAFAGPIQEALAELGISVALSGRNDLVTVPDGRKCSGTAECIYNKGKNPDGSPRKMLLHHGTLLFSAELSIMSAVLTPDKEKLSAKGIRSVKSRVVNLQTLLSPEYADMTAEDFKRYLEKFFLDSGAVSMRFSPQDSAAIDSLAERKYRTKAWLYGSFASGEKIKKRRFDFGTVSVMLRADGTRLREISFAGDFFGIDDIGALENSLVGAKLSYDTLVETLAASGLSRYIAGASPDEIAALICEAAN